MTFTQKSSNQYFTADGVFGFSDGTYDYLLGGWQSGATRKDFHRSADGGVTFTAQTDFGYRAHTWQACFDIDEGKAYLVGGDTYNQISEGDWRRSSHKFEAGSWSQIAANPGIENRCLGSLVKLGDDFYLIGGQDVHTNNTPTVYDTVLKSTDGLQTFTTILADTKTQGFRGGLLWGSCVAYKGEIWKVCGSIYLASPNLWRRGYETNILSSSDGITWTWRARFKGAGRHYHQCVVYNEKIYVFNGFHGTVVSLTDSPGNLKDFWTIEKLSSGKIVQTYKGLCDWGSRHAATVWANHNGIMFFGGTGTASDLACQDCWLYTE